MSQDTIISTSNRLQVSPRLLNAPSLLSLFLLTGWFILLNMSSFSIYHGDLEVFLSFGWPFICWEQMRGKMLLATFVRYGGLIGNLAVVVSVATSAVYVCQSWFSTFSLKQLSNWLQILAVFVLVVLSFDFQNLNSIALFLLPVLLALLTFTWRHLLAKLFSHTPKENFRSW